MKVAFSLVSTLTHRFDKLSVSRAFGIWSMTGRLSKHKTELASSAYSSVQSSNKGT
jgi:hypothetical protein